MSAAGRPASELGNATWARLGRIVNDFEDAWEAGGPQTSTPS